MSHLSAPVIVSEEVELVQAVVVDLDGAEIVALETPLEILAAPGPSRLISPFQTTVAYTFGTVPFWGEIGMRVGINPSDDDPSVILTNITDKLESKVNAAFALRWEKDLADAVDDPLYLTANAAIAYGQIASASVFDGGTGYAVNDTGTITAPAGSDVDYSINAVSGGVVTGFDLANVEVGGYQESSTVPTATGGGQPGTGTGFIVQVDDVDPGDGSVRIQVLYAIFPAA